MAEAVSVQISADTAPFAAALKNLEQLSQSFGAQLTGALKGAVLSGKDLDDILRKIGLNLAGMALNQGLKPLQSTDRFAVLVAFQRLLPGSMPFAKGGVPGHVVPFASGGVVSTPELLSDGAQCRPDGRGGSEAILPLQRSADGRLGVAASGGGAPVNVVFNVSAQDAGSFRKSEAQITGMLARAVSRGTRTF